MATQTLLADRHLRADAPALLVEGLSVILHRGAVAVPALSEIGFAIARGEAVAVVGESGSGKSTLGLAIQALLPAESRPDIAGSIRVGGVEMVGVASAVQQSVRRTHLGAVYQDPMTSLNPTMAIGRQLTERLAHSKMAGEELGAAAWLEQVGIARAADRVDAFPHQLSGGERQRVMIAMALCARPDLIVMDEPTTALDVTVQAQILDMVTRIRVERGTAVMIITHDLGVAATVAERAIVLYRGRIVEAGRIDDLIHRPAHPYTAALLSVRFGLGSDRSRRLATIPGEPTAAADGAEDCVFAARCLLADAACAAAPPMVIAPSHPGTAACWKTELVTQRLWRTDQSLWPELVAGTEDVLRLDGVSKHYAAGTLALWSRRRAPAAVADASLHIRARESVALVGESGSGKSTLLRIAAGLIRPDSGTRHYADSVSPQMVFQDAVSSLTPWLSVGEIVGERLRTLLPDRAARRARVITALAHVGLPEAVLEAIPAQLSGGQCQRVALARAIIVPPRLLLCDEPISAVDVSLAASILNLIGDLRRELGMALLFVTHDLAAARYVADRIVVLEAGRIVEEGPAEDLIAHPRHNFTRRLIAAVPEQRMASA